MKHENLIGKSRQAQAWARARATLLGAALLFTSCTAERTNLPVRPGRLVPQMPAPSLELPLTSQHTFVLITLDGVRHEDIFLGVDRELARSQGMTGREQLDARELTPNLHALMDRGAAVGAATPGIVASGPNFMSVPGYLELMTGRRPTGCTDNSCPSTTLPTLADEFAALPGVAASQVAVIASWEGVGRAAARDPNRAIVSVGRHHGESRDRLRFDAESTRLLDAGEQAGPDPGHGDYRRDRETAALALHYLSKVKPRFLFLGLGDTDEYAHRNDYRGYLRALGHADFIVGRVAAVLRHLEREGRTTTLFVTTDHGRSKDFSGHGGYAPESARVWLVAAGTGIGARGVLEPSSERHLADIAATIRLLAGLGNREPSSRALAELLPVADLRLSQNVEHGGSR